MKYYVTDTSLSSIADAIRSKVGKSTPLIFPSDFISGINLIFSSINNGKVIYSNTLSTQTSRSEILSSYMATYDTTFNNQLNIEIQDVLPSATWIPSSTSQIIDKDQWLAGSQIIAGDSNLVASNIASGVTIFGVEGTLAGGNEQQITIVNEMIERTTTTASFPSMTSIGNCAFADCSSLTSIYFPEAISIGKSAFLGCRSLTSVSFPKATNIGVGAFAVCPSLTTVYFPELTSINMNAFADCHSLTSISFPKATNIENSAFGNCDALISIYFPNVKTIGYSAFLNCTSLTVAFFPKLRRISMFAFASCYNLLSLYLLDSSYIVILDTNNAFNSTPISNFTTKTNGVYGSIYVRESMLASYKTNWSKYSERFVGLTDEEIAALE